MASIRARQTKAGDTTYTVLFRLDGRQTSRTFQAAASKRNPAKHAEDFVALVDALGPSRAIAELDAEEDEGVTVDELAERWLEWKAGDITPRTLRDYRRDYANWIKPTLGARRAAAIDEVDVQQLVDSWRGRIEAKSIADRHAILFSMYRWGSARTRRLVDHNPCLETQLPSRTKKPAKGATLPEYHAILTAARALDPDAADLIEFIAGTGWRWSEAAALHIGDVETYTETDVDGSTRTLTFAVMTAVFRRDANDRQTRMEDSAKSAAGFRRLRLTPRVAAMVDRRSTGRDPGELLFTNAAGRKWYQQNFLNRTWARIVERAHLGRHLTPKALRHSHVAMLDRAGASMPEIQRRIGHESITTTIGVYGGMIDHISDDTLGRLDRILDPSAPAGGQIVAGEVVAAGAGSERPEVRDG